MEAGIVSYGVYVPRHRITPEEIGKVWGVDRWDERRPAAGQRGRRRPGLDDDPDDGCGAVRRAVSGSQDRQAEVGDVVFQADDDLYSPCHRLSHLRRGRCRRGHQDHASRRDLR